MTDAITIARECANRKWLEQYMPVYEPDWVIVPLHCFKPGGPKWSDPIKPIRIREDGKLVVRVVNAGALQ